MGAVIKRVVRFNAGRTGTGFGGGPTIGAKQAAASARKRYRYSICAFAQAASSASMASFGLIPAALS